MQYILNPKLSWPIALICVAILIGVGAPGGHPAGAPRRRGGSGRVAAVRVKGASMNRAAFVVLFAASSVASQQRTIEPEDVVVFNRSVSSLSDGTKKGLRLSESPGDGVAYFTGSPVR